MDTPNDLLTVLLGLAQSHEVRANLKIKDNLISGTITMRPKRSNCENRVGVGPGGPTNRVDAPVSSGGDSSTGSSTTRPTPQEEAREAWRLLRDINVDQQTAQKLACLFSLERIREVTTAARERRSPSGYAITALQNGWKLKPTNGHH